MDHWGIIAWIGERTRPRVQRLAPAPSAFKALFAKGTVLGEGAENGTRGACGPRSLARAYRPDGT
jgi:hypothetical protein